MLWERLVTTGVGCLLVRLQILVWDYGHKFWFGIMVINFGLGLPSVCHKFWKNWCHKFQFSGAARHAARRSSKKKVISPRLSPMVAHGDKEECRTDSPFSSLCTVGAWCLVFRFCIEFESPTRGDSYARAKFVSTLGLPNFRVKPVYPIYH